MKTKGNRSHTTVKRDERKSLCPPFRTAVHTEVTQGTLLPATPAGQHPSFPHTFTMFQAKEMLFLC